MSQQRREFTIEEVFDILMLAREGKFDPTIPFRPTASPINRSVDCFYVVPNTSKRNSTADELRVKYNNVIRSKIWWSPKHNHCLGVVSRAMSMKTRSESHEMHRSYQHGFQGHWVSLLERPSNASIKDKALIRTYVQFNAPSLVQFWPAQPKARIKPSPTIPLPLPIEGRQETPMVKVGENEGFDEHNVFGVSPKSAGTEAQETVASKMKTNKRRSPQVKVGQAGKTPLLRPTNSIGSQMNVVEDLMDGISLIDAYVEDVDTNENDPFIADFNLKSEVDVDAQVGAELTDAFFAIPPPYAPCHGSPGDLPPRPPSLIGADGPCTSAVVGGSSGSDVGGVEGQEPSSRPAAGSFGSFPPGMLSLDVDQGVQRQQKLKRVLSSNPGEMDACNAGDSDVDMKTDSNRFKPVRRINSTYKVDANSGQKPKAVSNSDLELALDCIINGDSEADERLDLDVGSDNDDDDEESGSGKAFPSKASVVAFELFKNACDIMDSQEFSVWYERHVSKLFKPSISRKIKKCLDRNDPRLSPDFLFPETASFIPDKPVAYGLFRGTYSLGWELLKGSPELTELVGYETAGNIYFYETILESKVLDLFSHLVYKKKVAEGSIRPLDYYFQTIVVLQSGKRMVVRTHCWWFANSQETCDTEGSGNAVHVRMQDVSSLYESILHLPPLPY